MLAMAAFKKLGQLMFFVVQVSRGRSHNHTLYLSLSLGADLP